MESCPQTASQTLPASTAMLVYNNQPEHTPQSFSLPVSMTVMEKATFCPFGPAANHPGTQHPAIPTQICAKLISTRWGINRHSRDAPDGLCLIDTKDASCSEVKTRRQTCNNRSLLLISSRPLNSQISTQTDPSLTRQWRNIRRKTNP